MRRKNVSRCQHRGTRAAQPHSHTIVYEHKRTAENRNKLRCGGSVDAAGRFMRYRYSVFGIQYSVFSIQYSDFSIQFSVFIGGEKYE